MGNGKYEVGDFIQTEFGHYVVADVEKDVYGESTETFVHLRGEEEVNDMRINVDALEKLVKVYLPGMDGRQSVRMFRVYGTPHRRNG